MLCTFLIALYKNLLWHALYTYHWISAEKHFPFLCLSLILGEGIPSREKKLVTDGVSVQTSRGVIPFSALRPNIIDSSQYILPTDAGSRIGIMYVPQAGSDKAEMHFIINGEDQGVCWQDIPYKAGPLRAVVDVYGTTKQVRIVQLYGGTLYFA